MAMVSGMFHEESLIQGLQARCPRIQNKFSWHTSNYCMNFLEIPFSVFPDRISAKLWLIIGLR